MFSDLHVAHQGIAATTRRARETVYWPQLNHVLKDHVAGYPTCDQYHHNQPKEPLIFKNKSKVVKVVDRLHSLTSPPLVKKLKHHHARYGIPESGD